MRVLFWKSVKTCPKWYAEPNFFYFVPNYGSNGASLQKMSKIGLKLTKWWPKQSLVIENVKPHRARIFFWKLVKTCPKWYAEPNFFVPNYGSSGASPQKRSQIGLKLTKWWPKQNLMIENVKPHRARIFFWKLVKTCPKWYAEPNFFVPNYGSSGASPQKRSQIGLKLTKWWPKQNSVIEKVKPHRARILFWKSVKTCPRWFAVSHFFILSPTMAQGELPDKK